MRMTRAQALAEARRRWGEHARVFRAGHHFTVIEPGAFVPVEGRDASEVRMVPTVERHHTGATWEAAFAEADLRAPAPLEEGAQTWHD